MKNVCRLIINFTIPVFLITGCITNYNSLGVRLFKQGRILGTDYRMGHKPLEKLISQNIKRVWVKMITKAENELHV
jgi:hypothetical protein